MSGVLSTPMHNCLRGLKFPDFLFPHPAGNQRAEPQEKTVLNSENMLQPMATGDPTQTPRCGTKNSTFLVLCSQSLTQSRIPYHPYKHVWNYGKTMVIMSTTRWLKGISIWLLRVKWSWIGLVYVLLLTGSSSLQWLHSVNKQHVNHTHNLLLLNKLSGSVSKEQTLA